MFYVAGTLVLSVVAAWHAGPWLKGSDAALQFIGLAFSILAATLFAVVAIVGDPGMLLPGSRRVAWESLKEVQKKLQRLNVIFVIHLLTIFLLVVCSIVKNNNFEKLDALFSVLAFLATSGFLLSLTLPFELGTAQRLRLEQELSNRNKS
ncbi:hypothetical protein GTF97_14490 [Roseobacter sp. HKCCD8767]|uniref:hypothetical protein n=1 Tax=unclassified Roseobacter TaxID=196798 RepID=UPI001492D420|nr:MULTISPECIES: hypothetical protein [unclassified Roseobacter]NNV30949.1 hypothetical protein [Roseobacter sp. HKCCD9061]NNV82036.1 hypothetical protein [Roseobacter sp. HKCCD6547]NNV90701.1 hypothetical protein [Roseobacter sp. HKCCD9020]NNV94810.1 hypothetical protein [Roseobacter sp. HKCCD8914]NNW03392.1 hypothetical protein [Roseobacter sp. HKCCD9022]NNW11999.1 hypothetical protein [Roseobacter sp. HKCCD8484]NNW20510.1 hypothetical protein [Roseobacter sp. HKCCD7543]NNW88880.1 hypothe